MHDKALELEKLRGSQRMAEIGAAADAAWNSGAIEALKETSTLRRRINQQDWPAAAQELRRWVYGGGKVLPGLLAPRETEVRLFAI
jgi:lysozyme